jgi:hypothetical protein
MGIRALRLVAGAAAMAATFAVTAGPAGPALASTGEVVIAVAAGTWSQTRITGISFPMDTPAIAAS